MKFCSKCGKELMDEAVICTGCGCAVRSEPKPKEVSLDALVKGASTTNIISAIVLVFGIVCALFVNVLAGAMLCLVAELVALVPNSKLQKALKNNYKSLDKKTRKASCSKCTKDLKSKYFGFKFSFILGYLSFFFLIAFIIMMDVLGL